MLIDRPVESPAEPDRFWRRKRPQAERPGTKFPAFIYEEDQLLIVHYDPGSSYLKSHISRTARPTRVVLAIYESCYKSFDQALQLSPDDQARMAAKCRRWGMPDEVSARWWCLAGHTGDNEIRRQLGMRYRDSSATTRDLIQAYKWFSLAAIAGDKSAKWSRDHLSPQMDPAQLAEAERLVAEWEPNPAECEVGGAQAEN